MADLDGRLGRATLKAAETRALLFSSVMCVCECAGWGWGWTSGGLQPSAHNIIIINILILLLIIIIIIITLSLSSLLLI